MPKDGLTWMSETMPVLAAFYEGLLLCASAIPSDVMVLLPTQLIRLLIEDIEHWTGIGEKIAKAKYSYGVAFRRGTNMRANMATHNRTRPTTHNPQRPQPLE